LNQHIIYQFDSFCKKVLKYYARDYYTAKKRQQDREVAIPELLEMELDKLAVMDAYFKSTGLFCVIGHGIYVSNEALAEALLTLPADNRDIVSLAYFLDMSDSEISQLVNIPRRTVAYRRTATLKQLKKLMEEGVYE